MTYLQKFENWYPFEELTTLRNRMDRLMSKYNEPSAELTPSQWVPVADIIDTKNALVVRTELPGLTEKDITVEIENNMLTIKGERKFEKETKDKDFLRTERAYGTFLRTFTLPANVIPDKIAASYVNGILDVEIPKKEEAKPRTITVDVKKKLTAAA